MTDPTRIKPVHIGILGAGARLRHVLSRVLKHAPANSLRIVSAHDPALQSREALQSLLGYDFKTAGLAEDVTGDPDIDWVFIGSWNSFHARQAIAALYAGKNVFCEKPLAITLEDCLSVRDAVRESGRTFAFGLVLRYSPHYRRIRDIIDSGVLGKIISMEFNETLPFNHGGFIFGDWRRLNEFSGGHLLEKCCHDLDLANWFVGALPKRVASFGGRNFFTGENAGRIQEIGPDGDGLRAYLSWPRSPGQTADPFMGSADIFDNQVGIIEYANGVRATFHTNCNAGIPERRMYILGSHGALRADMTAGKVEFRPVGWKPDIQEYDTNSGDIHGGGDEIMGASLARTLLHGEAPLASVHEGICSAITAFAMDQACLEGSVVDLAPLWQLADIHSTLPPA